LEELRLLAGQNTQAQIGFGNTARAQLRDAMAEVIRPARVAGLNH
jgi:hypothetical protein